MTSLQPVDPPWYIRRATYNNELEAHRQRLQGALLAIRLDNAAKLTKMQIQFHIELGDLILARLLVDDNPLIRAALEQTFYNWLATSNRIISLVA